MIKEGELTIWCSYHNPNLIWEYNLDYLPSYIKLFNTNDLTLKEKNINYLNPHLNEIVTLYYVWKNNLYSKYVGFCHYRRFFKKIDYDKLEDTGCYYYAGLRNVNIKNFEGDYWKMDIMREYLLKTNKFNKIQIYKFFDNNEPINCGWKSSFILTWDKFVKLCETYFGFLNNIINDYTQLEHYKETGRHYGWRSEVWMGILLGLINDNYPYEWHSGSSIINDPVILVKSDNIDDIILWTKKNNRIGTFKFIISDKLTYNDLDRYEISDTDAIGIIKDKSEITTNFIELNINEYVKCVDTDEFIKENYTIEKYK